LTIGDLAISRFGDFTIRRFHDLAISRFGDSRFGGPESEIVVVNRQF
jgi:hypothetical protein